MEIGGTTPKFTVVEKHRHRPFEVTGQLRKLLHQRSQSCWFLSQTPFGLVPNGQESFLAAQVKYLAELCLKRFLVVVRKVAPGFEQCVGPRFGHGIEVDVAEKFARLE